MFGFFLIIIFLHKGSQILEWTTRKAVDSLWLEVFKT